MKIIVLSFLIFLFQFQAVIAEKSLSEKESPNIENNEFNSSQKKKLKEAQAFISEGYYESALEILLILEKEIKNPNINYHIGICYINISVNQDIAIDYLSRASEGISTEANGSYKEVQAPIETYFFLGKAYHLNNNYDMAINFFEKYKENLVSEQREERKNAEHQIKMCETAKQMTKNPQEIERKTIGAQINTKSYEFPIAYIAEENLIVYSSTKRNNVKSTTNQQNIYIAKFDEENNTWEEPIKYIDHTCKIKANQSCQNEFFFNKKGDIYSTKYIDGNWTEPQKLDKSINSKSNEIQACLSPTGTRLYFVSDREGGYGGYDIWYCEKFGDKWGPAVNAGSEINTEFDEISPYIASDGISLYFSSNGHNSMGGFDVFISILFDGFWTDAENLGYPLNTSEDDVFYIISTDEKSAYYSSTKENAVGKKDIYFIRH